MVFVLILPSRTEFQVPSMFLFSNEHRENASPLCTSVICQCSRHTCLFGNPKVISAAEVFFQPHVKTNKEITAPHFPEV